MIKEYQQQAIALGCNVDLRVVSDEPEQVEELFKLLWHKVDEFDKSYSRFIPGSLITRLNNAGGKKVAINQADRLLLLECKKYAEETSYAFNPFVLPAVQGLGYKKSLREDFKTLPTFDYSNRRIADISELEVGEDWARIPADSAIDIGAIGKGYLADELADLVKDRVDGLCFSLGGDIAIKGLNRDSKPWQITVKSIDKQVVLQTGDLPQTVKGVATSGLERNFNGSIQAHEIDVKTGKLLKTKIASCTVLAKSATDADVFASVALAGDDSVKYLLKNKYIISALVQYNDGPVKTFGDALFEVHKKHKPDMIEGNHEG